jgi:hypothetical protein
MTIPTMLASKAPDLPAPDFYAQSCFELQVSLQHIAPLQQRLLEHGANSGEAQELKLGLRFWAADYFSVAPRDG